MSKNLEVLYFTADSALIGELGQRLVGKPHVALGELVKNSYDADANQVLININARKDVIEVVDDGHGMNLDEFKGFWMRIGSPHKQRQKLSRGLKRPLTGSKGVGRLAVQLLAKEIDIHTVSDKNVRQRLKAHVDWGETVKADELTKATAQYEIENLNEDTKPGTAIILRGLFKEWDKKAIEGLAREIWWLLPPFRSSISSIEDEKKTFKIKFASSEKKFVDAFEMQIKAESVYLLKTYEDTQPFRVGSLISGSNFKHC